MLTPTREEFLAAGSGIVPLRRRVPADLETPVSAFLKLRAGTRGAAEMFLLESVEQGIQVGRYSFIGVAPSASITLRGGTVEIVRGGERSEHAAGDDPLAFVRDEVARTAAATHFDIPGPFAGAVGYVSYDIARYFEELPTPDDDALGLPDFRFVIPSTLVVFDHVRSEIEIVALPAGTDAAAYDAASAEIDTLLAHLDAPLEHARRGGGAGTAPKGTTRTTSNVSREAFEGMVRDAREHILAGDAFQIVLSQRLRAETTTEPFQIYRALRILNPSPYMFFLDFGDFQMVGSSPEVLVKLEGRQATVAPIAGTRPRGETTTHDDALARELLADEKERAEHVMLVDLGRNDLGRVCDTGSVHVDSLMHIERYSHVMHIVSSVRGKLRDEFDAFDLMRACFPAGTLSGAPKIRAMEIIADLEKTRRGPYGGAVGYFGHDGAMDMCITIRTIVMKGRECYVQAGAGIVADSDPAAEYRETLNKARALIRAVEIAEEGL